VLPAADFDFLLVPMNMEEKIIKKLSIIEKEYNVKIIYACESRGTGLNLGVSFVCGNEVTCHVTPNEKETPKFNPVLLYA
jgi:hypothetical protein